MSNPFSNRKKVRGWKRRIRQLEQFRLAHRELDVEALRGGGRHYVKIWLDPWRRLVPRNPPYWYRRRIVAAFVDILGAWRERLDAAGEPYYLEMWLFHPDFYDTQVVVAVGEEIDWYRNVFEPAEGVPAQPPAEYGDAPCGPDDLRWRAGRVIDAELASSYEGDFQALARLVPTADRVQQTGDGDTLLVFYRGLVWLGSLSSQPDSGFPDPLS
ncbi:hypothetical protein [Longimicrobium sp.]|uniref:hypothetical protein n=1 Tax=Longimicrobium sp. TaxID=2029185 RepID=UPI003B3B1F27